MRAYPPRPDTNRRIEGRGRRYCWKRLVLRRLESVGDAPAFDLAQQLQNVLVGKPLPGHRSLLSKVAT